MKYHIFDLEYLQTAELTEEDLKDLFDNKSFNISLIVGMFNMSNQNLSNEDIVKVVTSNNHWMYNYFWTKQQREDFTECLKKSYKNLYRFGDEKIESITNFWISQYGLTNSSKKRKKKEYLDS